MLRIIVGSEYSKPKNPLRSTRAINGAVNHYTNLSKRKSFFLIHNNVTTLSLCYLAYVVTIKSNQIIPFHQFLLLLVCLVCISSSSSLSSSSTTTRLSSILCTQLNSWNQSDLLDYRLIEFSELGMRRRARSSHAQHIFPEACLFVIQQGYYEMKCR